MPRSARFEDLGLPQHVIFQGIERCAIYRDDRDRRAFTRRARAVFGEMDVETLAWALMDNHGHLVLRPTASSIGKAMQRVLGPYAQAFNLRHDRVGRLFRDRFWSRPVEDGDGLRWLIGYVILNPLRGGVVRSIDELRRYPWSSLSELLAPDARRGSLVARSEVLTLFGPDPSSALDELMTMIAGQSAQDQRGLDLVRACAPSLSPRERADLRASSVLALQLQSERIDRVLRRRDGTTALRLRLERSGWTLDRVVARAAQYCGVDEARLRQGGRRGREAAARALAAHFAATYLGCCDADVARATGVSRQSVSASKRRRARAAEGGEISVEAFFGLPSGGAASKGRPRMLT